MLNVVQCLIEVIDDIFVMLRTDGEADRCRRNTGGSEFFRSEFRVGRRVRVNHKALHVGDVSEYNGAVVVRKKRTFRETKQKETLISVSCYF